MGRAHEVRAAAMAKTAAAKSKLYSRYGKELLIAAKAGVPDPEMNLGLKRKIAEAKANQVPADVIKRAIEKSFSKRLKSLIVHIKQSDIRFRADPYIMIFIFNQGSSQRRCLFAERPEPKFIR